MAACWFRLKAGRDAGRKFIDALSFSIMSPTSAKRAASPSSRDHDPLASSRPPSRRQPASPTLCPAVGRIEHIDDIIADLDQPSSLRTKTNEVAPGNVASRSRDDAHSSGAFEQ